MKKLAESSGTIIFENDNKLLICKKPAAWISTSLFVTGLLTFILLTNGLLQLFVFNKESPALTASGIFLSGAGILFGFIFWRIIIYRKKINATPPTHLKTICILDFGTDKLLDADQHELASIDAIQLSRKMQIGSSSPKLILTWDKKSLTIVNGSPFSGGVSAVEQILSSKGIKRV